jgi:CRISPR system Cascade subunit CasC
MFVELHVLQNFAPSNLNRDDTGSPKDCIFGGHPRARISSQCLKRTAREYVKKYGLVEDGNRAERSRRFVGKIAEQLEGPERSREQAVAVVSAALGALKFTVKDDGTTQYLLFFGASEIDRIVEVCQQNWDALVKLAPVGEQASKAAAKKAAAANVPSEVQNALKAALDGGRAADLAMFGRMLADLPEKNIDAASQVAHAISTHRVSTEFDYYTAVDDLNPEDTAGAGMIGTVEFNSACYYRYANVDTLQLTKNLGYDPDLPREALTAFLRAMILATPAAKQNSMAAQNPPEFVLTVVREHGQLWSLANAFENPVRPDALGQRSLVERSVAALARRYGELETMYGEYGGVRQGFVSTIYPENCGALQTWPALAVPELVRRTADAAFAGGAA